MSAYIQLLEEYLAEVPKGSYEYSRTLEEIEKEKAANSEAQELNFND